MKSDLYGVDLLCRLVEKKDRQFLLMEESYFFNYWGRYLGDTDALWVYERGTYYEKCYIEGCRMIAEEHQKRKEFDDAVLFYLGILQINAYEEGAMEQLLTCYCETGNWKCMKQLYKDFTKRFKKEMGIDTAISLSKIIAKRNEESGDVDKNS